MLHVLLLYYFRFAIFRSRMSSTNEMPHFTRSLEANICALRIRGFQ